VVHGCGAAGEAFEDKLMQELDICQIDAAVCDAVEKNIPLTVTFESGGWVNLRSRFVAVDGDRKSVV